MQPTFFSFSLTALFSVATASRLPPQAHLHLRQSCNGTVTLNTTESSDTIGKGDTLSTIAGRTNRGLCDIAKRNNITNPNLVSLGQVFIIPAQVCNPDSTSCLPPPAPAATATCILGGPDRFVVQDGLSIEKTAQFLNITLDSLTEANVETLAANGTATAAAGTVVHVPVCPGSSCTFAQATIKSGDLFDDIAKAAGSTTGQILAVNPGIDRVNLQVGQTFTLPSNCSAEAAE